MGEREKEINLCYENLQNNISLIVTFTLREKAIFKFVTPTKSPPPFTDE